MAKIKISQLPAASSPVDDDSELPINIGSATKRATKSKVKEYDITDAETAAGVTIEDYSYRPRDPFRYGAVGDGVTDDLVAFQAAVSVGGLIETEVTNASFYISDVVTTSHDSTVIRGPFTIIHDNETGPAFLLSNDYCSVDNVKFSFTGAANNYSSSVASSGYHNQVSRCHFDGNNTSNSGVESKLGSDGLKVYNNVFRDHLYMFWGTGGINNTIDHNYFTGGTTLGVVNGTNTGYTTTPFGDAIKLMSDLDHFGDSDYTGTTKNIITNNIFDGIYRDAMDTFTDGSQTIFSHNTIRNTNGTALDIKVIYRASGATSILGILQESDVIVSNNVFEDIANPYATTLAVISIVHYNEPEGANTVSDYTEGVKRINIHHNEFKNITGEVIHGKDVSYISIESNKCYDLQTIGFYFTAQDGTRDISIFNNELNFPDGAKAYGSGNVIGIQFTSGNHLNSYVENNSINCEKEDTNRGDTAIYLSGDQATANNNKIRGFDVGVLDLAGDSEVNFNRFEDMNTAAIRIGVGLSVNKTFVQCIGNKVHTAVRVINVDTTYINKLFMANNMGTSISGTAYSTITGLANYVDSNNVNW